MLDKGYLILAQNNQNDDYLKMAYVLALSIKLTQPNINSVALVTDVVEKVPEHYSQVFDHIISIPWFDDALESEWKIENRWKMYHVTPYEQTVLLDADMLFLSDIEHWWHYLENNHDLFITTDVMTYRNEIITERHYRKIFDANSLPNTYSAFTYFRKSPKAEEFWDLIETMAKNWEDFYDRFLREDRPKHLSIDVLFGLAVKILGIQNSISTPFDYPTFTHMKGQIQNWRLSSDDWMDYAGVYLNREGQMKIGNFQQHGIFHYTEKKFLDDYTMYVFENLYKEKHNG